MVRFPYIKLDELGLIDNKPPRKKLHHSVKKKKKNVIPYTGHVTHDI